MGESGHRCAGTDPFTVAAGELADRISGQVFAAVQSDQEASSGDDFAQEVDPFDLPMDGI
jgi:hypothetical protein